MMGAKKLVCSAPKSTTKGRSEYGGGGGNDMNGWWMIRMETPSATEIRRRDWFVFFFANVCESTEV